MLLITTLAVAGAAAVYYPFSRAAQTQHNLTQARAAAEKLAPMLAEDGRFFLVRAVESASDGGTLRVYGVVFSQDEMSALRALIENFHPSVGVVWSVEVRLQGGGSDDATSRPADNM